MRCPSCGFENLEGTKFCGQCATPLSLRCPQCGFENPPGYIFCGQCATPLTGQTPTPSSQISPAARGQKPGAKAKPTGRKAKGEKRGKAPAQKPVAARRSPLSARRGTPGAERRQLTVMFCDLVGSTALSEQLDPEELREVVREYQKACAEVIRRFEGHIVQYLGDGLLVYFGYPVAHEDDPQRAVRAGLEIVAALRHPLDVGHEVPSPLAGEGQGEGTKGSAVAALTPHPNLPPQGGKEKTGVAQPLQVRIGIHTGLVVVGEIGGGGGRHEQLALGDTPNIAARIQGIAEPDTVVISSATYRLVQGLFECQNLGPQELKGVRTPLIVYQVMGESEVQSRFEVAVRTGLTPLVGREHEVGLLLESWEK